MIIVDFHFIFPLFVCRIKNINKSGRSFIITKKKKRKRIHENDNNENNNSKKIL